VYADEVRPDHIPVHVLECEVKIVIGTQQLLQQLGDLAAILL
jgi:hypothetical protein